MPLNTPYCRNKGFREHLFVCASGHPLSDGKTGQADFFQQCSLFPPLSLPPLALLLALLFRPCYLAVPIDLRAHADIPISRRKPFAMPLNEFISAAAAMRSQRRSIDRGPCPRWICAPYYGVNSLYLSPSRAKHQNAFFSTPSSPSINTKYDTKVPQYLHNAAASRRLVWQQPFQPQLHSLR